MKKRCYSCGKGPSSGNSLTYRGLPKKKGGVGLKVTSTTKRTFSPNLQRVRTEVDGEVTHVWACTRCIKANKIKKPVVKKSAALA
jgi:large subunit ribosomal protein L28